MMVLSVNNKEYTVDVEPSTPLLWVIRDVIGLTGTKFGCGIGQCGACTIHLNGKATNACLIPVSQVIGKQIRTIEGLSDAVGQCLQQAWIGEDVVQCGYCQSGQIMLAATLLADNPHPTDSDIDRVMSRNICRCGTYQRIRKAIHIAANANGQSK
jgi:isoquinoline 1-oxidoreductase subunit alpha